MPLSGPLNARLQPCTVFFLSVVFTINVLLTTYIVYQTQAQSKDPTRQYCTSHSIYSPTLIINCTTAAYIGDDFPLWLEEDLHPVEMTFAETSRYTLSGPLADAEWDSIRKGNYQGYLRLGPERRIFAVSMLHQLHCVNTLRRGLTQLDEESQKKNKHHVQHCLSYLRQFFLCAADTTLEPYDYRDPERNFNITVGTGFTRECRDWSRIYDRMDEDANEWMDFANKYNEEVS
jgi:hypothetical protein